MNDFYVEIGRKMKSVRKAVKLTQSQIAEMAGIDASFYGQIERGTNIPSLKTFAAIAKALKVNPADLLPARGGGKERLYTTVIENLLDGLDTKRKALVLGLLKDIVAHYKAK